MDVKQRHLLPSLIETFIITTIITLADCLYKHIYNTYINPKPHTDRTRTTTIYSIERKQQQTTVMDSRPSSSRSTTFYQTTSSNQTASSQHIQTQPELCTDCKRAYPHPGKLVCKACKAEQDRREIMRANANIIVPPSQWKAEDSLDHPKYRMNTIAGAERKGWMK